MDRNRQVKDYLSSLLSEPPFSVEEALSIARNEGLKEIQVSCQVGRLLMLLSKLISPKRILEVGTLGGVSALWLVEGLQPGGTLHTLEKEPMHAKIAKQTFSLAGWGERIILHEGPALHTLDQMIERKEEPFDLLFLDADKESYPEYLERLLELSRPGSVLLTDNLLPKRGPIGEPTPTDLEAIAVYQYNQKIASHPRLETTLIPVIASDEGRLDALGFSIVKPI